MSNKPDFNECTQEEFDTILLELTAKENLLDVPGVIEIVSEYFNNDVLEVWRSRREEEDEEEDEEPTNFDQLRRLGEVLADFALAGGLNNTAEATRYLADENINSTIEEMFYAWEFSVADAAQFEDQQRRRIIIEDARERVADHEECVWCREEDNPTVVVRNATVDMSDIAVCSNCLSEVLNENDGAYVLGAGQ